MLFVFSVKIIIMVNVGIGIFLRFLREIFLIYCISNSNLVDQVFNPFASIPLSLLGRVFIFLYMIFCQLLSQT